MLLPVPRPHSEALIPVNSIISSIVEEVILVNIMLRPVRELCIWFSLRTNRHALAGPPPMPPQHQQHYGPQMGGQGGQPQQPYFQYSQCNGRKKALCVWNSFDFWSRLTLLQIGINYFNSKNELKGCINDARNMERFLCGTLYLCPIYLMMLIFLQTTGHFGYKQEDVVMLTDDARNPRQIPTRDNIVSGPSFHVYFVLFMFSIKLQAMQWLVGNAQPHDSLFFHCKFFIISSTFLYSQTEFPDSGHGGKTQNGCQKRYVD